MTGPVTKCDEANVSNCKGLGCSKEPILHPRVKCFHRWRNICKAKAGNGFHWAPLTWIRFRNRSPIGNEPSTRTSTRQEGFACRLQSVAK